MRFIAHPVTISFDDRAIVHEGERTTQLRIAKILVEGWERGGVGAHSAVPNRHSIEGACLFVGHIAEVRSLPSCWFATLVGQESARSILPPQHVLRGSVVGDVVPGILKVGKSEPRDATVTQHRAHDLLEEVSPLPVGVLRAGCAFVLELTTRCCRAVEVGMRFGFDFRRRQPASWGPTASGTIGVRCRCVGEGYFVELSGEAQSVKQLMHSCSNCPVIVRMICRKACVPLDIGGTEVGSADEGTLSAAEAAVASKGECASRCLACAHVEHVVCIGDTSRGIGGRNRIVPRACTTRDDDVGGFSLH